MSLRDLALNAADVPEELVSVPEWGDGKYLIRGLTAGEAVDFYDRAVVKDPRSGEMKVNRKWWGPELLIACVYDPETKARVFEAADRDALGKKASAVVTRLAGVAARLSGLGGDEQDKDIAADLDEAR